MAAQAVVTSWQVVNHPTLKKPIALVGSAQDQVVVIFPFYDFRDADFSGKLSFKERVGSRVPGLGKLTTDGAEAMLLRAVAVEFADPALKQQGDLTLLRAGYVAVVEQINLLYIKTMVGGAVSAALNQTSLTFVPKYFVKTAFKQAFARALREYITP